MAGAGGEGLRAAIETALKQDWQRLFSYAMHLTRSREAAGDLLQSCALKALSSRSLPADMVSVRAWIFTILRNAWIDEFRRSRMDAELVTGPLPEPSEHYDDRVIATITVRQALERLEPIHREIIELVDLAGFRYAEVASILGVPQGTVMSRLSRARLSLLAVISEGNVLPLAARRRHGGG